MHFRGLATVGLIGIALLCIVGCAALPLPYTVDLRASLADTERTVTEPVKAGEVETLDLRLPSDEGECIDFSETAPGATVHSAQLQWIVDAEYSGPELTGTVQARAYAAGVGDELFHPSRTLGPVFTLDLSKAKVRLAGAANLNPSQLQAINDREVCWGVDVSGEDIAALEDGDATIDYSIERLRLRITFSVI